MLVLSLRVDIGVSRVVVDEVRGWVEVVGDERREGVVKGVRKDGGDVGGKVGLVEGRVGVE